MRISRWMILHLLLLTTLFSGCAGAQEPVVLETASEFINTMTYYEDGKEPVRPSPAWKQVSVKKGTVVGSLTATKVTRDSVTFAGSEQFTGEVYGSDGQHVRHYKAEERIELRRGESLTLNDQWILDATHYVYIRFPK